MRHKLFAPRWGGAAIAAALCAAGVPVTATAQDAGDGGEVFELGEIFVVGTRRPVRSTADTPAPIDLIGGEDFVDQGTTELPDLMRTLVPSYNVTRQPINDESTFVRPANLRGLGPDQTLIFINGKRRHRAAVITNLGNGVSDGAQGPDISVIPAVALKRVEVLRDTASAQYGSDAIAGVINFVLKDRPDGGVAEVQWGQTYEGDGTAYRMAGNAGAPLGEGGFVNLSAQWHTADPTVRSQQRDDAKALIAAGNPHVRQPVVQVWGAPDLPKDYTLFLNSGVEVSENTEFYAFGNVAGRESEGGFFYRNPNTNSIFATGGNRRIGDLDPTDGVMCPADIAAQGYFDGAGYDQNNPNCFAFNAFYPGGFTPQFKGEISDSALTAGVRGELRSGMTWDLSYSFGRNSIDYSIRDTINPSLGPATPHQFSLGSHTQTEQVANFDVTYPVEIAGFESPIHTAAGLEWRQEKFEVEAGEEASWQAGDLAQQGFAIGSNGYRGFHPDTAGSWSQNNVAGYVDLETEVNAQLTVATMGRMERYDGFGSTADYKFGALYQVTDNVGIRGSASTGFRAPTPGQQNISRVATVARGATLKQEATLSPSCPEAREFGAKPLEPEESVTFTVGAVAETGPLSMTADIYNIDVDGRLGKSQSFDITDAIRSRLGQDGCLADAVSADFYGNGFDTRTRGIDVVASLDLPTTMALLESGETELVFVGNWTDTEVTWFDPTFLNQEKRLVALEQALPNYRFNATLRHEQELWGGFLRLNYFGPYTPFNNDTPYTLPSGGYAEMGGEFTVDVEVSYVPVPGLKLSVGAENVLDNYPDDFSVGTIKDYRSSGELYPENAPMTINGGFYYARARYTF